jgi:RND family efflux transporter MFP subunit
LFQENGLSTIEHPVTEQPVSTKRKRGSSARLVGLFVVPFVVFALLAFYSLSQRRSERSVLAKQTEQMIVPYVMTIHAKTISTGSELVLPGTLSAYVQSPIYARTNGYLKKWLKDIGSHVNKGELLAEIDTPEVDQQLAQARADVATEQANLELAEITTKRYQGLIETNSISQQDADNAKSNYAARKAALASAEANEKRLEEMEAFTRVYAPFAGTITQRNVDVGNLINAGNGGNSTKEMFDLAQIDPLRVYVSVPQSYAPSIRTGLKACLELTEFPLRRFCGNVVRTANAIDPSTRTLLTEIQVPNSSGTLLPGSYAQVYFDAKLQGERLTLPINALLFRPEGTIAATIGPGSRIVLKKVSIGRDFGNSVEVLQGLAPEDAVVINPPDSLEDGEKVNVKTEEPKGGRKP